MEAEAEPSVDLAMVLSQEIVVAPPMPVFSSTATAAAVAAVVVLALPIAVPVVGAGTAPEQPPSPGLVAAVVPATAGVIIISPVSVVVPAAATVIHPRRPGVPVANLALPVHDAEAPVEALADRVPRRPTIHIRRVVLMELEVDDDTGGQPLLGLQGGGVHLKRRRISYQNTTHSRLYLQLQTNHLEETNIIQI